MLARLLESDKFRLAVSVHASDVARMRRRLMQNGANEILKAGRDISGANAHEATAV